MAVVSVAVASAGRPDDLGVLLADLARQTRPVDRIGVCTPGAADLPDPGALPRSLEGRLTFSAGVRGLSAQRNAAMRLVRADEPDPASHFIAFFDDDSRVHPEYLERAAAFLDAHPDVVGLTGTVLLDGAALGTPVSADRAAAALAAFRPGAATPPARVSALYGCNMVFRSSAVQDLTFDEAFPLYSWLEDLDFTRRLGRAGEMVRLGDAAIVHLGSASGGRRAHRRFGYSQVANAVHLHRKGSISRPELGRFLVKGLPNNLVRSATGPGRRDRLSRVNGNLTALADLVRGRLDPGRILQLAGDARAEAPGRPVEPLGAAPTARAGSAG